MPAPRERPGGPLQAPPAQAAARDVCASPASLLYRRDSVIRLAPHWTPDRSRSAAPVAQAAFGAGVGTAAFATRFARKVERAAVVVDREPLGSEAVDGDPVAGCRRFFDFARAGDG